MFFEPILRKSLFKIILAKINPNGIDPDIYDKKKIKKISNVTVN